MVHVCWCHHGVPLCWSVEHPGGFNDSVAELEEIESGHSYNMLDFTCLCACVSAWCSSSFALSD